MSSIDLAREFLGLAAVVLLLGLRHGFDADHLAAIDALATHNAVQRPRLARLSGVLFSLGHGLVVVAVALGVSLLSEAWHAPQWLESMGMWVSVCLLTLLALVNIAGVAKTPGHEVARVVGWRSGMFGRLLRAGHPLTVLGVGGLFALSFDAMSQAALFAVTAAAYGGWRPALLLGLLFTAGMLLTDGINGWLIWRLIQHSDRTARVASRTIALAVSGVGLLTAGLSLATRFVPAVDLWAEGKELWFGAAVVTVVLASFLIGQRLAHGNTTERRSFDPDFRGARSGAEELVARGGDPVTAGTDSPDRPPVPGSTPWSSFGNGSGPERGSIPWPSFKARRSAWAVVNRAPARRKSS